MSQQTINQPGSYMLAPSYSEALLMDPAPDQRTAESQDASIAEMVPSYSEALLYQRAEQDCVVTQEVDEDSNRLATSRECSCPCHAVSSAFEVNAQEEGSRQDEDGGQSNDQQTRELPTETAGMEVHPSSCTLVSETETGKCGSCGKFLVEAQLESSEMSRSENVENPGTSLLREFHNMKRAARTSVIPRDMSEPNLRSRSELMEADTKFLRLNGQSLRNILECEQEEEFGMEDGIGETSRGETRRGGDFRLSLCSLDEANSRPRAAVDASRGAIPKRLAGRSRVIANPMSNEARGLPDSKTYFCLKSILKQNKRRYTLITARELQDFSDREDDDVDRRLQNRSSYHEGCISASKNNAGQRFDLLSRSRESLDGALGRRKKQFLENISIEKCEEGSKRESNR
ncbi:hypothetical protein K0M31_011165 [Melipona bicolor]|uniref:Uncharacterized protein n=1 Tax=Melipona bicolor TaxID=60889 RepID=A0AA40G910_9HYME|nr:hypothetical protein K0M31_011165 [Melipona bicolor]